MKQFGKILLLTLGVGMRRIGMSAWRAAVARPNREARDEHHDRCEAKHGSIRRRFLVAFAAVPIVSLPTFLVFSVGAAKAQEMVLTDSFCPLQNNGFNMIFITDPANPNTFRLISTNPGQFSDNVFDTGTPSTPVNLSIKIPYPFMTNGAFPIQISSSFAEVNGCFQPAFDQNGNFAVSTSGGNLSPSGHPVILLSDYGGAPTVGVTTTTVTVTGTIPTTGLVYVTIHLNYGLKGTTDWTEDAPVGVSFDAVNTGLGVTIHEGQSYVFSFTDGTSSSTSPTSHNIFKKDPGFAGVVTTSDAAGANPLAGVTVSIYDNTNRLIGTTTTDENGVYLFAYKYTGTKGVTYTVVAALSATNYQKAAVSMQSNKLILQNFHF